MTGGGANPDAMAVCDSINSTTVGLTKGGPDTRTVTAEQAFASSSRTRVEVPKEQRAKTIDVVFLLDATASMEPVIQKVKDKIVEIAEGVKAADHLQLRVGYVAYRDIDIMPRTEICDLTYSTDVFKELLGKVRAHSDVQPGCKVDEPEDVFSALELAQSMDWQSRVRTIIHIGDAPAHGREFHDRDDVRDNFSSGDPSNRNLADMLRFLRVDSRVNLYIFVHAPNPLNQIATRKMVRVFKQASNADAWWLERDLDEMEGGLGFVAGIVDGLHTSVVRSN